MKPHENYFKVCQAYATTILDRSRNFCVAIAEILITWVAEIPAVVSKYQEKSCVPRGTI